MDETAAKPGTAHLIDQQVRADKLQLLFHQSFPALFVSLLTAVLLSWMLWQDAAPSLLLGWLAALSLATVPRLRLFLRYFRERPSGPELLAWERPYMLTLLASSLTWGLGALLVIPADSIPAQALSLFVLVGMAGGATSTYSAHRLLAVAAMAAVLLPTTLWLYLQPDRLQLAMALGASLFMLASLRTTKVLAQAMHRSFHLTHALEQANAAAEQLAKTDALTELNNRRAFFEQGRQLASHCQRNQRPLSALLLDLDHFKQINDSLGHGAGDQALQRVAGLLRSALRKSDLCGRIGGEEFAVLLPETPLAGALLMAEKLRNAIASDTFTLAGQALHLSASIGVASADYDLESLLLRADAAMYQAKTEGRNRVMAAAPLST